jgi:hypothetical protein
MVVRHFQLLASSAAIALTVLLCAAPTLAKRPEPAVRKIPPALVPLVRVYTDGKGHFLIVPDRPPSRGSSKLLRARQRNMFFGSAKLLYRLRPYSTAGQRLMFSDPRRRKARLTLDAKTGPVFLCDQSQTKLQTLDKEATKRFLAKATLRDSYWRHEPHLLARTSTGEYFYVDRKRMPYTGPRRAPTKIENMRGFRMWRGRRGRMKRLKLKDVVIDAAGQVFLGKKGSLHVKTQVARYERLIIKEVSWRDARTKKHTKLISVPIKGVRSTWILIHRDLGPYRGQKFGLPCDVW